MHEFKPQGVEKQNETVREEGREKTVEGLRVVGTERQVETFDRLAGVRHGDQGPPWARSRTWSTPCRPRCATCAAASRTRSADYENARGGDPAAEESLRVLKPNNEDA